MEMIYIPSIPSMDGCSVPGLALQCQTHGSVASAPARAGQQVRRAWRPGGGARVSESHGADTGRDWPPPAPTVKSESAGAALCSWIQKGRPDDISPDVSRCGRRCCAQNALRGDRRPADPARRSLPLTSVIACPLSQVRFRTILFRKNSFSKPGRCLLCTSARRSSGRLHSANAGPRAELVSIISAGIDAERTSMRRTSARPKNVCVIGPFCVPRSRASKFLCARDLVSPLLLLQAAVHSPQLILPVPPHAKLA